MKLNDLLDNLKILLAPELYEAVVHHLNEKEERFKNVWEEKEKALDKITKMKAIIGHYFIEQELEKEPLAPEDYR